jgi:tetratricopeptide (TPR) repeat protein
VVRAASGALAGSFAAGLVLALLPVAVCAFHLDRARDAVERGEPALALERMDHAARVLPVVAESSDFALQRGLLQTRLGLQTPEAKLYEARVLQGQGLYEQAETLFASLLTSGPAEGPVHREAVRGILRRGIRQLNSGETTPAIDSLEAALRADPCNVKASYVLQLAYLRVARFESLRELVATMRTTYRFFNSDTKVPILSAAQENIAYAAYLQGDPAGAHAVWKTLGDAKTLTGR